MVIYQSLSQFSGSVVSDSLWSHEPQHIRPPCPLPTPRDYPNSCPLSWWCHLTISPSVIPFSSCPQSFPTSGSFQMSQLFASGGQNIVVSASTWVLPMNTQDWFPLGWTGWISLTRWTWTFVDKVMPLLFNMLSRLVIAFLPRRKHLLISWLQLPSSDFGAQEDKVCHCFHFFHNYLPWSDGTRCHDLSFLNIEF